MGHRGPTGPSARFAIVDSAPGVVKSLDELSHEGHRAAGVLDRRVISLSETFAILRAKPVFSATGPASAARTAALDIP